MIIVKIIPQQYDRLAAWLELKHTTFCFLVQML